MGFHWARGQNIWRKYQVAGIYVWRFSIACLGLSFCFKYVHVYIFRKVLMPLIWLYNFLRLFWTKLKSYLYLKIRKCVNFELQWGAPHTCKLNYYNCNYKTKDDIKNTFLNYMSIYYGSRDNLVAILAKLKKYIFKFS